MHLPRISGAAGGDAPLQLQRGLQRGECCSGDAARASAKENHAAPLRVGTACRGVPHAMTAIPPAHPLVPHPHLHANGERTHLIRKNTTTPRLLASTKALKKCVEFGGPDF